MSFIERALEKVRNAERDTTGKGGAARLDRPGTQEPGQARARSTQAPEPVRPRVVVNPAVAVSDELLREAGVLAAPDDVHQQAAEFRSIKRELLNDIADGDGRRRLVMVTSALSAEGKTFTAVNLALSLALEQDWSVLLVDADIIKPALSKMLGLQGRQGLLDAALDSSVDVNSLILTTSVPGLSVIPAGRPDPHASEYFASERMDVIWRALLADPRRIVVIDSLPVLLTSEAPALTQHVHNVLMVVRAERTPQAAVRDAIERLGERAEIRLVLNAEEKFGPKDGYYYGYNYEYNYRADNQ
ncbi:MAG: P-loop NTPase [Steroidobacteraceae bacterium]